MYIFDNFSDELHFLFGFFSIYLDEKIYNFNNSDKNLKLHPKNVEFFALYYA